MSANRILCRCCVHELFFPEGMNTLECAACGTLMEADAMFCPNCGAQKELPKEPEVVVEADPGKVICPGCGKQVEPKAFCAFCGTKLS